MSNMEHELTAAEWKQRALDAEARLVAIDGQGVGSHHGDPILTRRDVSLLEAYTTWVSTMWAARPDGKRRLPGHVDWLKSRLFWRIRSGRPPLKYPPPTAYSCPWYELIEVPGPHDTMDTLREADGAMHVAQSRYDVLGRDGDKWVLGFGPYRFRAWNVPIVRKWVNNHGEVSEVHESCGWIEYVGVEEPAVASGEGR